MHRTPFADQSAITPPFPKAELSFHKTVYLFLCVEDLSLLVLGPPELLLLEVSISQRLGDLQSRDVHLGVGSNAELLVSSTQGNPVESQRT